MKPRPRQAGRGRALLLACLICPAGISRAHAAPQSPEVVEQAVRAAINAQAPANATITLGPVNGAHYMKACTVPLSVTITGTQPYLQAAALCVRPRWTLYVSAEVEARIPVVVAAQTIPAGQPIQASDVTLHEEPLISFAGRQIYTHISDVLGDVPSLTLPAGTLLTGSVVQRPVLVRAGQVIMVDVRNAGIDVTLDARANQEGRLGDLISVTNLASGRVFQATVTTSGALVQLSP